RRLPLFEGEVSFGPAEQSPEAAFGGEREFSSLFELSVETERTLRPAFGDRRPRLEILPPEACGHVRIGGQRSGLVQLAPGCAPSSCLLVSEGQIEAGVEPLVRRALVSFEFRLGLLQHRSRIL